MTFTVTNNPDIHHLVIDIVGKDDIELFKVAMNRALNCWDRAPGHLKEFGDLVTEGKVLQNYVSLASEQKKI